MARSDIASHAKTLTVFTHELQAIEAWQRKKDVEDARREEREKIMVQQLAGIYKVGWAILTVLVSGIGLAIVNFVIRGGLYLAP